MTGLLSNLGLFISIILFGGASFYLTYALMKFFQRDKIKVDDRKKKLRNTIRDYSYAESDSSNDKKNSGLMEKISKLGVTEALGQELLASDIMVKPEEFITIWAGLMVIVPGLIFLFSGSAIPALLLLVLCFIGPFLYIRLQRGKKIQHFDEQLGDALLMMGNCLTAGLSFQQAMENIAREMPDPIASEFGRVVKEMRFGKTTERAITDMIERIPSKDLMIAMNAVLIQHQVGGNLSEILETISITVKDRLQIKKDIKVMTAQGRYSGLIVGLLPVVMCVLLTVLNPTYMAPLIETSMGRIILLVAIALEAIGAFFIKKIITIEY